MATVQQIGDARPDGSTFGASASTKISFYGATPVVQAAYCGTFSDASSGKSMSTLLNLVVTCLTNSGLMAAS